MWDANPVGRAVIDMTASRAQRRNSLQFRRGSAIAGKYPCVGLQVGCEQLRRNVKRADAEVVQNLDETNITCFK